MFTVFHYYVIIDIVLYYLVYFYDVYVVKIFNYICHVQNLNLFKNECIA